METIWQLPVPSGLPSVEYKQPKSWEQQVGKASIEKSRTKQTILETVHLLQQATAEMIVRLNWSPGYLRDIQKHIAEMVKVELLEGGIPPKYTRFGSAPQVYLTARKAAKFLKDLGHDVKRYRGKGEERRADPHT
jgi:hypothetical protein